MRALICGAGIAGLALARTLGESGWDVVVVERSPEPRGGGYLIDFFGPGFDVAEATGLLPRLRELANPIQGVEYVDAYGRTTATLDYARFADAVGGRLLSLMRGDVELALYETVGDPVELRFGRTVDAVEQRPSGVVVTLSDGTREDVDLLVGADGVHSRVRELVFGPEREYFRYLGFHTAAYLIDDPGLRERLGGRFALTDSIDRQFGLYAVRGGGVTAFTVHRSADPELPDDPQRTLRECYGGFGWLVPDALAHCPRPPRLYYDQVAQIEMPTWSDGRVALVGDACQAVSLLAGQGASLAVTGAHLLATELGKGDDIPGALARYERRLLPLVREKQAAGRKTAEWFLPRSRARLLARRGLLRAMRVPGLRRALGGALAGRSFRAPHLGSAA
ncbi:2-polyprenyl-6-methoxyphenol hydroxylase-like FAD-dependent oxidoreductase [Prauserella shujinwangii]|uniref:2-polyprenyl-6-methoxyphenol hydroxylase-like FAD-dependent oxidoreductase n=1 Tax=Prauserella shujinwangii TaxID=1453103 RepID=A0A2T0LZH9_9PSEU|nr:FAD-dependent monooxygenase [Prauserella shujinwangii]PRX49462.1 2-polyprenyl-6-methoxyphenol hydroxylase-like FAD-dependent oxidoreductase [Prauserella shujinwangii]